MKTGRTKSLKDEPSEKSTGWVSEMFDQVNWPSLLVRGEHLPVRRNSEDHEDRMGTTWFRRAVLSKTAWWFMWFGKRTHTKRTHTMTCGLIHRRIGSKYTMDHGSQRLNYSKTINQLLTAGIGDLSLGISLQFWWSHKLSNWTSGINATCWANGLKRLGWFHGSCERLKTRPCLGLAALGFTHHMGCSADSCGLERSG